MNKKQPIKINKLELETFLENCAKLLPHIWNILTLNDEIIDRQLEPIEQFYKANKNISKNDDELKKNMEKNSNFSDDEINKYSEIMKQKLMLKKDLKDLSELLFFLKKIGILEAKLEHHNKLDDIDTNIEWVKKLQKKELKS